MVEERHLDELDEIMSHIAQGNSFLLSGGAGSGKTYSLVETVKNISEVYPTANIACITYTNAAAIEIKGRAEVENLTVSTIHDFLWSTIAPFQKQMKSLLKKLVADPSGAIKISRDGDFSMEFEDGVQYKEFVKLEKGIISHDEVLVLAHAMYDEYVKLCDILKDRFQFIFVDEYQDTSPYVIEILLFCLAKSSRKNIVGFFGDSMQAIYDEGIGDVEDFVVNGFIKKVEIKQNRRNPNAIITLANKLRTDGLEQTPTEDCSAPNMFEGNVIEGSIKFLYSDSDKLDLNLVKSSPWCKDWDFTDAKKTKELRLTHNLIAAEAGYPELMSVYDKDPIFKFKNELDMRIKSQGVEVDLEDTFDNVVKENDWTYLTGNHKGCYRKDVLLDNDNNARCYNFVKDWPYYKVQRIYLNKDNLIDDKVVIEGVTVKEPKRDRLIQHLFKIQEIVDLYNDKKYNELIRRTSFKILSIQDKVDLRDKIHALQELETSSIEAVIEFAHFNGLCIKDDRLVNFINDNEYLYWRIKDISFVEVKKLYRYVGGYVPISTQHKIKGLEFENVLVVMHNGGWNNYNFEYLLDRTVEGSLTPAKKKSYPRILKRTQKLFYVCCTRAMDNLVVYCPNPTQGMIDGANELFGEENVEKIITSDKLLVLV